MFGRIGGYLRAHHVGLLALFVALSGTGYAATNLRPRSVGSTQLKSGAVGSTQLQNGAITLPKLSLKVQRSLGGEEYVAANDSSQTSTTVSVNVPAGSYFAAGTAVMGAPTSSNPYAGVGYCSLSSPQDPGDSDTGAATAVGPVSDQSVAAESAFTLRSGGVIALNCAGPYLTVPFRYVRLIAIKVGSRH